LPLTHANPLLHTLPLGFFWHVPLTQLFPPLGSVVLGANALQSTLVLLQLVLQVPVVASHWNVPHEIAAAEMHAPAPLQVGAGTFASDSDTVPPDKVPETDAAHEAVPHTLPVLAS
jgi:hypothetical protein